MNALKSFWKLIKLALGFPPEPTEEQLNEKIPTMRALRDCLVVALAVACGVTYEKAYKALSHWDLPFFLESPILSNPLNAMRGIKNLGFDYDDSLEWRDIAAGNFEPRKLLLLVKDPSNFATALYNQHWVVVDKINERGNFLVFWGHKQEPIEKTPADLYEMFHSGVLKCAIEIN